MREYVNEYIESLMREKALNTVLSYRQDLLQFCSFAQEEGLKIPGKKETEAYIEKLSGTVCDSSLARKMSVLNRFYGYLLRKGAVSENPMDGIEAPHVERRVKKKLSESQARQLIEKPKGYSAKAVRDRAMFAVMLDLDIKTSELTGLRLKDAESLKIAKETRELLDDYIYGSRDELKGGKDSEFLFLNCSGDGLSRQGFWKIMRAYGRV